MLNILKKKKHSSMSQGMDWVEFLFSFKQMINVFFEVVFGLFWWKYEKRKNSVWPQLITGVELKRLNYHKIYKPYHATLTSVHVACP